MALTAEDAENAEAAVKMSFIWFSGVLLSELCVLCG